MTTQEKLITRAFVLTPNEIEVIAAVARISGSATNSAALRRIIREWADANLKEQPKQEKQS